LRRRNRQQRTRGQNFCCRSENCTALRISGALLSVLPHYPVSRTLKDMEVHFTPEQEAQLSQIATHVGTDAERLVKDAALRMLQEEARFRAAVREGMAQADRGEFIEEEEMDARIELMLRS
jgi:predicted transcriptional regulator